MQSREGIAVARKSRKQTKQIETPLLLCPKSSLIQVAAYIRLSVEDVHRKGDSIETQKRIILNYVNENPDFELYDTYIDTGVSGTTFNRAEFQRMLHDAETGKINCIIVKDLSRLGRNVIDTGYYAEIIFPKLYIRLISINDSYDSANTQDNFSMPLINLVNEAYALDISRKVKSQVRQAMKDGVYVGGQPPYGYRRAPDDRHKLIADTVAADVVKEMFTWASESASDREIARRLNTLKIPPPCSYKTSSMANEIPATSQLWYARTVERILKNEIYLGRLVQGRTKMVNYRRCPAPSDEWICVEQAHEAIIPLELYQAVQSTRKKSDKATGSKSAITYSPNIFKGKIFCAHCGSPLERKKNHDKYIYRCVTKHTAPNLCNGCRISEDVLLQALREQLVSYRGVLADNLSRLSIEIDILPELNSIEKELNNIRNITKSLYENMVTGILSKQEYIELRDMYREKSDGLNQQANEFRQTLDDERTQRTWRREFVHILDEFAETMVITKELVVKLVKKVTVFKTGKVHFDFLDYYDTRYKI